ncbi:MAG TPA: TonB-dependent receptor [Gemmatirosa sp.]
MVLAAAASPLAARAAHAAPSDSTFGRRALAAPPVVGVVRDSAGQPLANVQVVIATLNRGTTTDDRGTFEFRGLAAGRYHIDALLIGYRRADVDVVVPTSGPDVQVAISMRRTALQLQNVVVTATPVGADPLRLTQSTVSLSGKELARNLGSSVAQTLSNEPGMAMRFNGPAANVPVIRGLSGERILVLQDGNRAGDLSSAAADHGLSIDPLVSNRIEVVRGPASLLYGTNALGGVVNVISNDIPTDVPRRTDGFVSTNVESVNPGGALAAGVTAPISTAFVANVRGSFRSTSDLFQGGGARLDNSYNRNQNGLAALGYVGDKIHAGLAYSTYDFDYGLPFAPGDDPSHIQGQRQEVKGRADLSFENPIVDQLRVDGTAQWYHHSEIESNGAVGTRFGLRTQTLNATARTHVGPLDGAVGLQGLLRQYTATGEEALTPAANTVNGGVFVYQELPLTGVRDTSVGAAHGNDEHAQGIRLQFGARADAFQLKTLDSEIPKFGTSRSRSFDNFSGSLGLSFPLAERTTFGVSAARSFRAPSVEELYSNAFHAAVGTYDVGDPNLKAETDQGFDGVFRTQRGRVDAQLSGYYNRIDNYITPNVVGSVDATTGQTATGAGTVPLNVYEQRNARLYGAEGRIEVEAAPHVVLGTTGDLVRGNFTQGIESALPYLPPARLGANARFDDSKYSFSAEVRHAFAQTRTSQPSCATGPILGPTGSGNTQDGTPCLDIPSGAYTLVNLSAGITLSRGPMLHTLTLRADNLLDERYIDATSRIKYFAYNPGRNIALVYRVQF